MEHFTTTVALIGIVVVIASLLSGAIERSGVPIVAIFLLLGAVLGPWGLGLVDIGFQSPALHALATLALALVLFSDAVTINLRQLRERRRLLWRLLGPGTLGPALITAVAAWLLLDVPVAGAAILGAALASTDPVLLRAVLRSRALPETPRIALRIEAGMNDVVLLPIVVLAIHVLRLQGRGGPAEGLDPAELSRSAIGLFVLGPLLGALVGGIGISALGWVRTHIGVRRDYESLYALGLAFTAYAAAETVGGSGFVAAFTAGLLVAVNDMELCDCFLEYGEATAEMLLLFTFVALGTSLIWTGLTVIAWPTLLFAVVALGARTAVLYPVLARSGVYGHDRRLIALFGPRGLSSLLLTLLPVFAGVAGAERLFTITSLVVMLSVLIHGTVIALFLRRAAAAAPMRSSATEPAPSPAATPDERSESITIGEMRALEKRGEPIVFVDARKEAKYQRASKVAAGAVRLHPDDPVRDATAQRLSQHATLVVYCD